MAKLSVKKTILLLIATLLMLAFAFRESLAIQVAHAYISYTCRHALHAKFAAERLFFEKGQLIIDKPHLFTKREIREGGFRITADRLAIDLSPHWFQQPVDLNVTLQNPSIELRQATSDMRFWLKDSFQPLPFLNVNARLTLDGGTLAIHDFSSDQPTKQTLFFKVEAEGGKQNRGSFVISLDDPLLQTNCVILSLARLEKRHIALDLDLDGIEGRALLKALRNILPGLEGLQLSEGLVKGKMALTFPRDGRPFAQGELGFYDMAFALPELHIQGRLEEAHLYLKENPNYPAKGDREEEKQIIPRTIGHLELTREGSLVLEGPAQPLCAFQHLKGVVYFQTQDGARLTLEGTCRHRGETSRLQIDGGAHFANEGRGSLDLSLRLLTPDKGEASAHLITRQLGSKFKFVEVNFARFGPHEVDLLQTLFAPHMAGMHPFEVQSGTIDGSALAYLRGLTITDLKVEKIAAKDLRLRIHPWEMGVAIEELTGDLSVNCAAANILDTLNTDLTVTNGCIQFTSFNRAMCRLHNVQTQFTVRKGVIQKSLLLAELGGLQGTVEIDGTTDDKEMVKARFEGEAKALGDLAPESLRERLRDQFADDHLALQLSSRASPLGWLVEGTAEVSQKDSESQQTIDFGFDVELCSPQEWLLNLATKDSETPWQELGMSASLAAWAENVSSTGFFLHEGWCRGQNLPLNKYLPLIYPYDEGMEVAGYIDFQGNFNHTALLLHYGLRDIKVENSLFAITLPGVPTLPLAGVFRLDLSSGRWESNLPVQYGSYLEKHSDLLFQKVKTDIVYKGETLFLDHLETEIEGMRWKGSIAINRRGPLEVAIQAKEADGQLSQLLEIFTHFEKLKFLQKLPLEGRLALGQKGADLRLSFLPEGVKIEASAQGDLQEGTLPKQSIDNLQLKFDYNHAAQSLAISDIEGHLKTDKPERLSFHGAIWINNLTRGEAKFDLSLDNLVRLKGKSGLLGPKGEMAILFDRSLTHLGATHPDQIDLTFTPEWQIDQFHFKTHFGLDEILPDLQWISRTGLMPLPLVWQEKLNALTTAQGKIGITCAYEGPNSLLTWQLEGSDLNIGDQIFERFLLQGKKRNATWTIDTLQLDDFSLSADIKRQPDSWKINFLGLRWKESLLLGLEGEYREGESVLDTKVNLMEIDLGKISTWPSLQTFASQAAPGGYWRGTGQLRLEYELEKGWRLDTVLNGTLRSWTLCGLKFQDATNISCHYVSDQGLTFRHLSTALLEGETPIPLIIEKAAFDFTKEGISLEGVQFNLPSAHSKELAEKLRLTFPAWIDDKTVATIAHLKQQGNLEGEFHIHHSPVDTHLKVVLGEGLYHLHNTRHPLHRLELSYDFKTLHLLAHYHFPQYSFWAKMTSSDPDFSIGDLWLFDQFPSDSSHSPLKVSWKVDPEEGWIVQKAEGNFSGLNLQLERNNAASLSKEHLSLVGQVTIDPTSAASLISEEIQSKIKTLQIGSGYHLNGYWQVTKGNYDSFFDRLHFKGNLEGNQVVFKGYLWQKLHAHVHWIPGRIQFSDLKIEDPAGTFSADTLTMARQEDNFWTFEVPKILASNYRPSLMQEPGVPPNLVSKPLIVKSLELESFSGYLHDSNSWKGKGKFYFINPPKKHLQNTIFAIPVELLTLIGLDMTALNPVSGTVLYEMRDGKVLLTKFKDVYSEGRLSKFYLVKSSSYMDLGGNLNVQIRMKQHNLFFKLAELFTINIQGPITKPVYSLQRQGRQNQGKEIH